MTVLVVERFSVSCASDRLRAIAAPALEAMRATPGALWTDLASAGEGFVLLSEWRTAADADAWEGSQGAESFARALDPVLVGERTQRRFGALI